jgi:hypothetical protein
MESGRKSKLMNHTRMKIAINNETQKRIQPAEQEKGKSKIFGETHGEPHQKFWDLLEGFESF